MYIDAINIFSIAVTANMRSPVEDENSPPFAFGFMRDNRAQKPRSNNYQVIFHYKSRIYPSLMDKALYLFNSNNRQLLQTVHPHIPAPATTTSQFIISPPQTPSAHSI